MAPRPALRLRLVIFAVAFGALVSGVCGCPLTDDRRSSDAAVDARDAGSDR